MNILRIEATDTSPEIFLDSYNQFIRISGVSRPENVLNTYSKVLNWIEEHKENFTSKVNIELFFKYINTSSQKMVYELLFKIKNICKQRDQIKIKWFYKADDIDIQELGDDIANLALLPFEVIAK